jgi:hypothetical protein
MNHIVLYYVQYTHETHEIHEIYNISNIVKDFYDTLYIKKIYSSKEQTSVIIYKRI